MSEKDPDFSNSEDEKELLNERQQKLLQHPEHMKNSKSKKSKGSKNSGNDKPEED